MDLEDAKRMAASAPEVERAVSNGDWQKAGRLCLKLSKQPQPLGLAQKWVALGIMCLAHGSSAKDIMDEKARGEW